jgi:tetratricopeptide (TPR) repeat protein
MVTRVRPFALALWLSAAQAFAQQPVAAPPDFDTLLAQAMQLHQAGDVMGAIDAYTAALKLDPERADARSNLGAAYVRLGRFEEAIEQYKLALRADPANPAFHFNLGLAYYKAGLHADAIRELEPVVAAQPDNVSAVLLLADSELQQGEYQRAIDLLAVRESQFPDDLAFGYILGTALVRMGHRDRGQVYIDRIFKAGATAEAHLLIGTALLQARDFPAAVPELKKAVDLNPQLPSARTTYGRALLGVGDAEAAIREFQRALQSNPNDFEANLQLGALRKRDQRNDEALVYLNRAMRLRPHDPAARFAAAGALLATGKVEEARALLEQVVLDLPNYTEAHVLLATSYYRLQRTADGDRHRAIAERLRVEEQARQPKPGDGLPPDPNQPPAAPKG